MRASTRKRLNVVLAVGLTAALLGGLGAVYKNYVHYELFPKRFANVHPDSLYRSGLISSRLIEGVLRDNRIDLILFLSEDKTEKYPEIAAEIRACEKLGVERMNFPLIGDGTGDWRMYVESLVAYRQARAEGRRVLVHCHAGTERTGAFVAFHRLLFEGADPDAVWNELVAAGHNPRKNPNLQPYFDEHLPLIAAALVERGVLEKVPDPLPLLGPR